MTTTTVGGTTTMKASTTTKSSGPCCGTWSAWTYTGTCSADSCGTCEMRTKTRTCLTSATCPCIGNATWTEPCSRVPCNYPKQSCCSGFKAQVIIGKIVCTGPPSDPEDTCATSTTLTTPTTSSCCGTWSAWASSSTCPADTCGACNMRTKTRTCTTSPGCPCIGPTSIIEPCNTVPCTYPKDSCCGVYKATPMGNSIVCAGPPPPSTGTCVPTTTVTTPRPTPVTAAPCCGAWSAWTSTACPVGSCGGCEMRTKTRTCTTSSTCSCTGPSSISEPCSMTPCSYPKPSCCGSYKAQAVDGKIACSGYAPPALGTCTPATTKCCPTGGIWSDWGPRLNCTDTCGAYGTAVRLRTCLTAADGCACTGSARKTVPCAFMPCNYPRSSCNAGYKPTPVSGKIRCVAISPPPRDAVQPADCCPPGGVWALWSAWSACTTKCGSCSRVQRTRKCASKRYGCPCANNATTVAQKKYCNPTPCTYPEDSCCVPFKVKSLGGKLQCV